MFTCNRKKSLVTGCIIVMVSWSCRFFFDTTKDQFISRKETSSFERGRNLVYTLCAGCHFDQRTEKFSGKSLNDLPTIAGHLYSSNLTHSSRYGSTEKYTDAELFYLFKTGIARNGKFMPYMMKPMMADEDINDLIIYLRSDDAALAANDTSGGQTRLNLVGRTGIRFLMKPQPFHKGVARPDEDNPVAYGKYLVAIAGCYHCHSSKTTGLDFSTPEKTKGYLQGGIKLKDPKGKRIYAPNLTPDKETGVGNYTKKGFRDAVRKGITPSEVVLSPPMDKFTELTDKQVDAIYDYLQSLPPVKHAVKPHYE